MQSADKEGRLLEHAQEQVRTGVEWLRLLVETLGATVIAVGIVLVIVALARRLLARENGSFTPIRLTFARYLLLALELQLAADILSTSVSPSWDQIGKLAAIAVIRTALNYFLNKEMEHESAQDAEERARRQAGASG